MTEPFASMTAKKDIFKMRDLGAFDGVGSHLPGSIRAFQTELPCLIESRAELPVVFSLLVTIAISLS